MTLSVVIPNYNHEPYLKQRIDSVLTQAFQDFELIILDDYSTDNSREIIEQYRQHPKVSSIVYNEENSGSTFKQWKKGIDLAKGEWIWIAESDDYCEPTFLSSLLDKEVDNSCKLRYCISFPVDNLGKIITKEVYKPQLGFWQGLYFIKAHLLELNRIPNASGVIVNRELLDAVLTPEIWQTKLLGDWLVWFKIALKTNIYYSEKTINYHRQHSQTVRNNFIEKGKFFNEFSSFRKLIGIYIEREVKEDLKEQLIQLNRKFNYKEEGLLGCELIRNKKILKAIPHILKASFIPNFTLYYIKSALYWLIKPYKIN